METALLIGILVLLGLICYEDFRSRMISLWLLIGLLVLQAISLFLNQPFISVLEQSWINTCILILLFAIVMVYYFLKCGHWVNIFDNYIGTGDILLLLIISLGFSPVNFLMFVLTCFILILIITGVISLMRNGRITTIPLAGYLAIFFGLFLIINAFVPDLNLSDDSLLFAFLTEMR